MGPQGQDRKETVDRRLFIKSLLRFCICVFVKCRRYVVIIELNVVNVEND